MLNGAGSLLLDQRLRSCSWHEPVTGCAALILPRWLLGAAMFVTGVSTASSSVVKTNCNCCERLLLQGCSLLRTAIASPRPLLPLRIFSRPSRFGCHSHSSCQELHAYQGSLCQQCGCGRLAFAAACWPFSQLLRCTYGGSKASPASINGCKSCETVSMQAVQNW